MAVDTLDDTGDTREVGENSGRSKDSEGDLLMSKNDDLLCDEVAFKWSLRRLDALMAINSF